MKTGEAPGAIRRRCVIGALLVGTASVWQCARAAEPNSSVVTVKVPLSDAVARSGQFSGYRFDFVRSTRKGEGTDYQRLIVKELPNGELQLHRRNDNGVAGSGVVAIVRVAREESASEVMFNFELLSTSTYQEGLFLKKAVPAFSLREALLEGAVTAKFETDSDYGVDAVRANFKRMAMLAATPGGKETWRLSTPSGQQYVQLEFFPYRSGAKVTTVATISARETSPGVIDFGQLLQELQAAVRTIVKA